MACPSTTQCTAVDGIGRQVAFAPTSPASATINLIDGTNVLNGVACPPTTPPADGKCTAVDGSGQEITFLPATPGTPTPVSIDGGQVLSAVALPVDHPLHGR